MFWDHIWLCLCLALLSDHSWQWLRPKRVPGTKFGQVHVWQLSCLLYFFPLWSSKILNILMMRANKFITKYKFMINWNICLHNCSLINITNVIICKSQKLQEKYMTTSVNKQNGSLFNLDKQWNYLNYKTYTL